MVKPFIRIGRKSKDESLKNSMGGRCRLGEGQRLEGALRDPFDNGEQRFFLKDTSKFGTLVNGKAVPQSGEMRLPEKAKIQLAEAVTLQFRSRV
jgi:hypothetical protein